MDTPAEAAAAAPPRGRRRQVEEEEVTESKRLGMWKTHLLGQSPLPNVPLQRARPAPRAPQPSVGLGPAGWGWLAMVLCALQGLARAEPEP